jgi:ABC-2 type transport system permease protein
MLRDLSVLMSHFLRVLFYVSPTLYGVDMVQQRFGAGAAGDAGLAAWLPKLYMLNPFAALITGYREAVFYGHFLRLDFWALIVVQSLLLLWAGYQTYQYFDRRVIKFL